jgi:nitroreductase
LIITVGYPKKEEIRQKKRKALADIVHINTYKR